MAKYALMTAVIATALAFGAAPSDAKTFTGPRGTTATADLSRTGTTGAASGSITGPQGNSVSGSGSASYSPRTGVTTGSGTVTGPEGVSHSATGSAGNGSATITGANGQTKTWTRQ